MGSTPHNEFSGGNFAGPIITGGKVKKATGGTVNLHTGGEAENVARLLVLLRQLRAEIDTADVPRDSREVAAGLVDQLAAGVDPEQDADAEPSRLRGLFSGVEALVRPLSVGTELVTQIGKLLSALFG